MRWSIRLLPADTSRRNEDEYSEEDQYFYTVYGHMQRLERPQNIPYDWNNKGIPVRAGDVIGYVNSTGASTGNHLHWSLYPMRPDGSKAIINGYGGAVDPTPYCFQQDPPIMKNQTKVVLGHDGRTVWICTPCSMMEVLKERASVEGFELPAQIPPAATL